MKIKVSDAAFTTKNLRRWRKQERASVDP